MLAKDQVPFRHVHHSQESVPTAHACLTNAQVTNTSMLGMDQARELVACAHLVLELTEKICKTNIASQSEDYADQEKSGVEATAFNAQITQELKTTVNNVDQTIA
jgi:hypothetical protein